MQTSVLSAQARDVVCVESIKQKAAFHPQSELKASKLFWSLSDEEKLMEKIGESALSGFSLVDYVQQSEQNQVISLTSQKTK